MRTSGTGMPGDAAAQQAAAVQQLMVAAAVQSGRRSLDAATAALKRMENPAIANARCARMHARMPPSRKEVCICDPGCSGRGRRLMG